MSINLMEMAKGYLTDAVVGKAASFLGESESAAQSGINHILPSLLGSVMSTGSSKEGANDLMNMLNKPEFGGGLLDNIGDLFGGGEATNKTMDMGGSMLKMLMGDKLGGAMDLISAATGMKSGSTSGLMKMLAPMLMSVIGKKVKADGLGLDGLMGLLAGQKDHLEAAAPEGFMDKMMGTLGLGSLASIASGFAANVGDSAGKAAGAASDAGKAAAGAASNAGKAAVNTAGKAAGAAANTAGKAAGAAVDTAKKAPGAFSRILPLLLLLGALAAGLWAWKSCGVGDAAEKAAGAVTDVAGDAAGAVGDAANAAADLVGDAAGLASKAAMSATDAAAALTEQGVDIVDGATGAIYNAGEDMLGKAVAGFENLGKFVKTKLADGTEIIVPEYGVENQLIAFVKGKADVDENTWFNFDRILFETGSANIDAQSMGQVKNIAAVMKAYPDMKIKIGGYTDNTGNPESNLKLSDARANAVMNAVAAEGVDASRMTAEGYGEAHPVADNATEEGRQKNRRIAVNVTAK